MPRVECPKCEAVLEVEELGSSAQCPNCEGVFPALAGTEIIPTCDPKGIARFLAGIYEPIDGQERAWLISEAKSRVAVPGNFLQIIGVIGVTTALMIGMGVLISDFRQRTVFVEVGGLIAIGFYFSLIAAGGWSLARLENRGLCFAAAALAVASSLFCGIWIIISLPAVIFGTWAFAALHNPVVRHAMQWIRKDQEDRRQV